jgi:hypothetical protein
MRSSRAVHDADGALVGETDSRERRQRANGAWGGAEAR